MKATITAIRTDKETEVELEGQAGDLLNLAEEIVASVIVSVAQASGETSDSILEKFNGFLKKNIADKESKEGCKPTVIEGSADEVLKQMEGLDNVPEEVMKVVKELKKIGDVDKKLKGLKERAENATGDELLEILSEAIDFAKEMKAEAKKDDNKTA